MSPKRKGLLLMALGGSAILLAIGLTGYHALTEHIAAQMSRQALMQLQSLEDMRPTDHPESVEMPEVLIDGECYIGQLNVPELDLQLPVISQWSYPRLKKAPCRYSGTIEEKNLVLLGHNYKRHFGRLRQLDIGSTIEFQDVNGNIQTYQVATVETVSPTEIKKVTGGEYALTLFTCTYGGRYRTMVGCNAVIPSES